MKVKNITNVDKFFDAVRMCEGYVELVTQNGDRLSLNATLSQYVTLVRFFSGDCTSEMEIITHNDSDAQRLFHYIIN